MTRIEWCQRPGTKGESWNPIRARHRETGKVGWYCAHVSGGCKNCYAEAMNAWRGNGVPYAAQALKDVELYLDEEVLTQPLKWRKPRTVFVASMTDLYADFVPDEWIHRIKAVEALCPRHTFIELTKRPERMREYLSDISCANAIEDDIDQLIMVARRGTKLPLDMQAGWHRWARGPELPLPNVWAGVSAEDQAAADARIPILLDTPAAVRLVSLEPLLGAVDLTKLDTDALYLDALQSYGSWPVPGSPGHSQHEPLDLPALDWVILGGESGPNARPMHPSWARTVRDQCHAAGVPFFFKQWGGWRPAIGGEEIMRRVGKKAAGRMLDGREHNEWPEARP